MSETTEGRYSQLGYHHLRVSFATSNTSCCSPHSYCVLSSFLLCTLILVSSFLLYSSYLIVAVPLLVLSSRTDDHGLLFTINEQHPIRIFNIFLNLHFVFQFPDLFLYQTLSKFHQNPIAVRIDFSRWSRSRYNNRIFIFLIW